MEAMEPNDFIGCRACMKPHVRADMRFLFDDTLQQIFTNCTSLNIDETDKLPPFICNNCTAKLMEFSVFRRMCETSDSIYRQNISIKVERPEIGITEPEVDVSGTEALQLFDSFKVDVDGEADSIPMDDYSHQDSEDDDYDDDDTKPIAQLAIVKKKRIKKSLAKHRCNICAKFFQKKHRYEAHMRSHKGLKGYECTECQKQFAKWSTMAKHSRSVHGTIIEEEIKAIKREPEPLNKMECEKCGKVFHKRHRMMGHLRTHRGLKPYACEECGVSYLKWQTYKLHLDSKHAKESFTMFRCDYEGCGKEYNLKHSMIVHRRRAHMGEAIPRGPRSVCEMCGKSFRTPFFLKEHMYTHGPVEMYPFGCEVCPKRFISKYKFKIHMMRHNKIKNHECPICGMRTTTGKEMKIHIAYHEKNVPYPCDMCTSIFQSHVALTRHKRVVHRGHKPYVCTYCNTAFSKADTLKHHTMRHTGEKPHACTLCDRRFIQVVALRAHMKTHNRLKTNVFTEALQIHPIGQ